MSLIYSDIRLAVSKLSLGLVFILTALSAPIARAFLITGSEAVSPTVTTVIVPPKFSLIFTAFVKPNSSYGLIMNCIQLVSNSEF